MRVNRAIGALGGLALSFSITFPAGAAEPIIVGSVLDETGGLNIYGKAMVDSTNLAIKHINEQGGVLGRQLKLVSYDSQSDNAKYTLYANQLALQDKAVVIMGGITSASREAMRPIMDRNKLRRRWLGRSRTSARSSTCWRRTTTTATSRRIG